MFQGRQSGFVYGRQGNPTSAALEAKVNAMEEGVATVCFSTGMAAIAAVCSALLKAGDHVIASHFLFGNTNSLFQTLESHGTPVTFVDATDVADVERALRPGDAAGVRRDDREPAYAGRRPRADRQAVRGARPALLRGQHDDLAVAVQAEAWSARAS